MIRRFLCLALFGCAGALADQWQVSALSPVTGCSPVCGPAIDLGTVAAGDTLTVPFRLANVGTADQRLYLLQADGTGFSASSLTEIPIWILPLATYPNGYLQFSMVFQPSCAVAPGFASARLYVNTATYTVTATVTPGAQACTVDPLSIEPGSIDFGKALRGASVAPRMVVLSNPSELPVAVEVLSVTGDAFVCPDCTPMTLGAGHSVSLPITWQPQAAGTSQGTLRVNQRTVSLAGTAVEPPEFADITVDGTRASRQQVHVSVKFASAAQASGKGVLKLDFLGNSDIGKSDDGMGFLPADSPNLALSLPFTVAEGADAAPAILLLTGTTAGTLRFTATLGDATKQVTIQIPPAAVGIDSVRAVRGATGVLVTITGFDNTRSVSQASFTFYDTSARAIGSVIAADVTAPFRTFFQNAKTGVFVLRAAFPVTGSVTQIGSVAVQLTNSAGTSSQPPTILE